MDGDIRREQWERRTEGPLMLAALLFLGAFAWPIITPDLDPAARTACWAVSVLTWLAFAVDYAVRVVLSRDRRHFVLHHPLDLFVVVLPMFRPLALLRLVALLGVLNRRVEHAFHGRVLAYLTGASVLLMTVSALLMLQAERGRPGAVIDGFGDAMWWAATTVTTVGYGDTYPTTAQGRLVAVVLMFGGIALIGVVTATVAAWLVRRVAEQEEEVDLATQRDVERLVGEVAALRQELAALRAGSGDGLSRRQPARPAEPS